MNKMTLIYSYTEEATLPHCGKSRPVRYNNGVVGITMREVTSDSAPVAILAEQAEESMEYRWYAGRLLTAVNLGGNMEPSDYRNRQHPAIDEEIDVTTSWAFGQNQMLGLRYDATKTKHLVAAEICKQMEDHLIVDGIFYRPVNEPRYVVMTQNHGGTAIVTAASYKQNIGKSRYFSLLQRDEAIASAKKIARNCGGRKSLPIEVNVPKYQVLMPDVIFVNSEKRFASRDKFMN